MYASHPLIGVSGSLLLPRSVCTFALSLSSLLFLIPKESLRLALVCFDNHFLISVFDNSPIAVP